jgi:hypothetical protein
MEFSKSGRSLVSPGNNQRRIRLKVSVRHDEPENMASNLSDANWLTDEDTNLRIQVASHIAIDNNQVHRGVGHCLGPNELLPHVLKQFIM